MTFTLPSQFIEAIKSTHGAVVFIPVRNEMVRLPAWIRHWRGMGNVTIAAIDNGSTDGTYEFLQAQPDVCVMRTEESFAAANFGMNWLNEIHNRVQAGRWVLFADADECLVYRGWPHVPLADYLARLDHENRTAVYGVMVDMYPDGPVDTAVIPDGQTMFDAAPCYDGDYLFRTTPVKPWHPTVGTIEVIGGPRVRILSSYAKECRSTWWDYFLRGQIDRVINRVPDWMVAPLVRIMPKQLPQLSKPPIVLSGSGCHYINNHGVSGGHFFRENVVVCHFKFLSDFVDRVKVEAARKVHFRRGAEYIMYAQAIRRLGELDLRYANSIRFTGSDAFVKQGLIRDVSRWLAQ